LSARLRALSGRVCCLKVRRLDLRLSLIVLLLGGTAVAAPRQIRVSLDDAAASAPAAAPPSHAAFPLSGDPAKVPPGRVIRLSLEDGASAYGHLSDSRHLALPGRHIRTTLE
jgi:hypothetical protein